MKFPKLRKLEELIIRERYFTGEEIKLILNRLTDDLMLTIFVKLSLYTGGRLETTRSIQVKDINFNKLNNFSYLFQNKNNTRVSKDYTSSHLHKLFNESFNQNLESDDRKNRAVLHTLSHTFATQLTKVCHSKVNES